MTAAFNSNNEQAYGEHVFAGYVKRRPTAALRRIFQFNETIGSLQNATQSAILSYPSSFRNKCVELIESGGWESGTVSRKNMNELTSTNEGPDIELKIEEKNIYFY